MRILRSDQRVLLRLVPGEEIMATLERFAQQEQVPHAQFFGIGACENAEIGFFDLDARKYNRRTFQGRFEVTSLVGNIAWVDDKAFCHAHITLGDADYRAWTGHLFRATVTATLELTWWPASSGDSRLTRQPDDYTGLKLWGLPEDF